MQFPSRNILLLFYTLWSRSVILVGLRNASGRRLSCAGVCPLAPAQLFVYVFCLVRTFLQLRKLHCNALIATADEIQTLPCIFVNSIYKLFFGVFSLLYLDDWLQLFDFFKFVFFKNIQFVNRNKLLSPFQFASDIVLI